MPPGLMELLQRNLRGELYEERLGVGTVVAGKWELTEHLGSGGFGHVYEGWHLELDGPFALKFLDAAHSSAEAKAQFLEEARMMNRLADRKHLVHVSDCGALPDGTPYFVMERLWGKTLRQRLADEPQIPIPETVEIAGELLEGLAQVHGRGLVHGDIKPENIFLSQKGTRVRLLDFGLAKTSALTSGSGVGGTPPYMAPEVLLEGRPVEPRSDLYAVGVVLYEMIAGRLPRGHLRMGLDRARAAWSSGSTQSVRMHREQVPDALRRLVDESVSRNPQARPTTALAMLERLRASVDPAALAPTVKAIKPRVTTALGPALSEAVPAELPPAMTESKSVVTEAPSELAQGMTVVDSVLPEPKSTYRFHERVWVVPIVLALALVFGLVVWYLVGPWSLEQAIANLPVALEPNSGRDASSNTDADGSHVYTPDVSTGNVIDQESTLAYEGERHSTTATEGEGEATGPVPAPKSSKPNSTTEPAYSTDRCKQTRDAARAALDQRQWEAVAKHARNRRCWSRSDQSLRTSLLVYALLELGRFRDCIAAGSKAIDAETMKLVAVCRKRIN